LADQPNQSTFAGITQTDQLSLCRSAT